MSSERREKNTPKRRIGAKKDQRGPFYLRLVDILLLIKSFLKLKSAADVLGFRPAGLRSIPFCVELFLKRGSHRGNWAVRKTRQRKSHPVRPALALRQYLWHSRGSQPAAETGGRLVKPEAVHGGAARTVGETRKMEPPQEWQKKGGTMLRQISYWSKMVPDGGGGSRRDRSAAPGSHLQRQQ